LLAFDTNIIIYENGPDAGQIKYDHKDVKIISEKEQNQFISLVDIILSKKSQGHSADTKYLEKEISIWFKEDQISLGTLANLLASLGYEPLLNSDETAKEKKRASFLRNQLVLKLGVAGFCAGNAMLFSFPEYLGIEDGSLKELFGYLNVSLGSIAVFYSGSDYLKNVWAHLKIGKITIELPILLGILVGYFRSVYEVFSHTGVGYIDSVSGLLFFLLIGKWFQQKSFDFLSFERKYTSYFPLVVTKWKEGREESAPLEEIEIGEFFFFLEGAFEDFGIFFEFCEGVLQGLGTDEYFFF
jgi:cation transport ATPase